MILMWVLYEWFNINNIDYFQGVFVRTWCPELARLSNEYIQTPWLAPGHILKEAGVELGVNYPRPIIIVPQWNQQVNFYMILVLIYIYIFRFF
jgi:deoxyribodipyrimidine photolyase